MTPDFKKYLKFAAEVSGIFIIIILSLNLAGRFFIEEITQSLFTDTSVEGGGAILEAGKEAPYFELHNLKGKLVKLSDYKNTPLVIVFWNSWNSVAENQFRIIDDFLKKGDPFFKIITVNSQEDRKLVSNYINRGLYSKPEVLLDFNGSVSDLYEARNLPATYFIDKDGVLRDFKMGILSGQEIVDNMSKYSK